QPLSDADCDVYVAFSEFSTFTTGFPGTSIRIDGFGYPLPPKDNNGTSPSIFPPELAGIVGLSFPADFSFLLGGAFPEDSWSQYTQSGDPLPTLPQAPPVFPIFTIANADSSKFLTFEALPGGDNGADFVASYTVRTQSVAPATAFTCTPFL